MTSTKAIISHLDSDHWRLLEWNSSLLSMVSDVVLPSGQPALALKSKHIKPKVSSEGSLATTLGAASDELRVYRSRSKHSDRNGECLVCEVEIAGKKALLAGDYVYSRMKTDGLAAIARFVRTPYDAIVIPHHGDKASARDVPSPSAHVKSLAFFSAGNPGPYGHPPYTGIRLGTSATRLQRQDSQQRGLS